MNDLCRCIIKGEKRDGGREGEERFSASGASLRKGLSSVP